jgi:hypothetical protein
MTLSMYQASLPTFINYLNQLTHILKKGEEYAKAKKIEPSVLLQSRLAPDMFPLVRQVQIACDITKGGAGRLSGAEIPSFPDTETTFAELYARIDKTIAFFKTISAAQVDGTETKAIELKVGGNELKFKGQDYLLNFVLPNLYFHVTTTYAILRHNGVDVGKSDYLLAA